jgi:hypothetical protein
MLFFLRFAKNKLQYAVKPETESSLHALYFCSKIKRQRSGLFHPLSPVVCFVPKGLLYDFFPAFEEV